MQKVLLCFALVTTLAACGTFGDPFAKFPDLEEGKGQLVIFNRSTKDSKLQMRSQVLCNEIPCTHVLNGFGAGGYTVRNYAPGKVTISMKENPSWVLGPTINIRANSLDVELKANERGNTPNFHWT